MSERLWFGTSKIAYYSGYARYYDVNKYAWATAIEARWPEIKEEIQKLIDEKDKNFVSNAATYKGIDQAKGWSSLAFLFWGLKISDAVEKKCPTLFNMLNKEPGLVSVSFSRLEPHTQISEHHGETNAIIRCHLGIEIPVELPDCGIKVAAEKKGWEEGKWVFFNDAQQHSAWNNSDKRRILLIVDFIRPEFLHKKNFVCVRVLAGHFITMNKKLSGLPRLLRILIFVAALPIIWVIRPFYNTLGLTKLYHE